MKTSEAIILAILLFGILLLSIGSILYTRNIMLAYSIDWTLQVAVFGIYIIILALVLAKLLQKVME